jgi:hypothetical protein
MGTDHWTNPFKKSNVKEIQIQPYTADIYAFPVVTFRGQPSRGPKVINASDMQTDFLLLPLPPQAL